MSNRMPGEVAVVLVALVISGCGQSPPATPPKPVDTTAPKLTLAPTSDGEASQAAPGTKPASGIAPANYKHAAFLGTDVVGLVVVHPQRLTTWPMYQALQESGLLKGSERQMNLYGIAPEAVEELSVVIDQTTINRVAQDFGLEVAVDKPGDAEPKGDILNENLLRIGLAFHLCHETKNRLPRANGDGEGENTGLSWRVHLLPFLDPAEADLYEKFHLDEPWDSDHNKTLIAKMPNVFRSPAVTEPGHTSVHVLTGKDTPFDGDKGKTLAEITDGTANTILAVRAGPDTADVWTKPGGLPFDPKDPKKSLGDVEDKFLVLMCDGLIHKFAKDVDDQTFANLIQINDGLTVEFDRGSDLFRQKLPSLVLTLTEAADRKKLVPLMLGDVDQEVSETQGLYMNDSSAVWFVDDKTIACGPIETVNRMMAAYKADPPASPAVLLQLDPQADIAVAVDVQSQSELMMQAAGFNPALILLQQIKAMALQLNVTGKPGGKLLELVVTAVNAETANALVPIMNQALDGGRRSFKSAPLPRNSEDDKLAMEFFERIVDSANIKQEQDKVRFLVPIPDDFEKLPELAKPAMKQAAEIAIETRKLNDLKQMGLSFHNYEGVNGMFPGAGRSAEGKAGLSWRVHLLPYLDEMKLYNKFNLDEPWDSETNKALIDQMPEVYKSPDVTEVGKTSMHVFTGPGAVFAGDQTLKLSQIVDGLSNTILAVQAGPDTAEIWTKPGGLEFDPEDPIKCLGKIADAFKVVLCDGAAQRIPKSIKPENLRRLIQYKDGEAIEDF